MKMRIEIDVERDGEALSDADLRAVTGRAARLVETGDTKTGPVACSLGVPFATYTVRMVAP